MGDLMRLSRYRPIIQGEAGELFRNVRNWEARHESVKKEGKGVMAALSSFGVLSSISDRWYSGQSEESLFGQVIPWKGAGNGDAPPVPLLSSRSLS